jgi:hypothetical protein
MDSGSVVYMKSARQFIAVTLMATAICADRSLPAARVEPVTSHFAGRLIERLTVNFRRAIPAGQLYKQQRFGLPPTQITPAGPSLAIAWVAPRLSPFQFRLPPPVC